jgi:large repetitive protein
MKKRFVFLLGLATLSVWTCLGQQPGTLLWSYNAGSTITTSPAIASDGTIYIGSFVGLFAITNAGSNKWSYSVSVASSPSVASNNTIYFGSRDGNLYALNPDASLKWTFPVQAGNGSPAVGPDGTIYMEGFPNFYAINPSGTKKWEFAVGDSLLSSPIIR